MLYKTTPNMVAINPDLYISTQTSHTWRTHSLQFQTFSTSNDYEQIQVLPSYSCPLECLSTWYFLSFFFGSVQITDPDQLRLNILETLNILYVKQIIKL